MLRGDLSLWCDHTIWWAVIFTVWEEAQRVGRSPLSLPREDRMTCGSMEGRFGEQCFIGAPGVAVTDTMSQQALMKTVMRWEGSRFPWRTELGWK